MEELEESLLSNIVIVPWDSFSWDMTFPSVCSRYENGSGLNFGQEIVKFYCGISP